MVRRRSLASQAPYDAFLDTFCQRAGLAFVTRYADTVGGVMDGDLLKLFLIEKAAYEICYEAANRPAWLNVPLFGLAQLLSHL